MGAVNARFRSSLLDRFERGHGWFRGCQKAKQLAAGRIEGALPGFGLAMREQRPAVIADEVENDLLDWPPSQVVVHLQLADDLTAESPDVVAVLAQCRAR